MQVIDQEGEVYKLVDPRDKANRYVGITKDADKRLKLHIRDARQHTGTNAMLREWILELDGLGLSPEMHQLERTKWQNARSREEYWILELTRQGDYLLNVEGLTKAYSQRCQVSHPAAETAMKQHRLRARLSIAQLARLAQIDETTVRRAESGQPVQEVKAYAIAEALSQELKQELSIDDLGIVIYGQ